MAKRTTSEPTEGLGGYLRLSRSWPMSLLFIAPLVLLYEIGAAALNVDIASAAHIMKGPLTIFGSNSAIIFHGIILALVVMAVVRLMTRDELKLSAFPFMFLESCIYGFLLGPLTIWLMKSFSPLAAAALQPQGFAANMVVAAGAGVYEEILFRGILIGVLFYVLADVAHMKPVAAGVISIIVSASVFSAIHFLNPAEQLSGVAFVFRLVAALILTGIYFARGLGIACYTHAIYDMIVFSSMPGS
jgi:uncharacterized membrane protein YvlD (DUF360 family)